MKILLLSLSCLAIAMTAYAAEPTAAPAIPAAVSLSTTKNAATLSNDLVSLDFGLAKGTYSVTDAASREVVLGNAGVSKIWEVTPS